MITKISYRYSHVIFSERRIFYDYDKYGDSPTCLNDEFDIGDIDAIIQGFGITGPTEERGTNILQEGKVITATNENCTLWVKQNAKHFETGDAIEYGKGFTFGELADGINNGTLCSWGIKNEDTGIYTVSTKIITSKFDIPIYL